MLDLGLMDTASLYFEGAGGQTLGRRGFSKDHRPELNQMILAVLLDGDGRPVCTEMWPGNTADTGSVIPVVDRLRKRFSVWRVCVIADRGMISAETMAEREAVGFSTSWDLRAHRQTGTGPGPRRSRSLHPVRSDQAQEGHRIRGQGRDAGRTALHRLPQLRGDEERRRGPGAILTALERQLKKGDKSLVGKKGYRCFLATPGDDRFAIDRAKAEEDAKFDGVFVLRTNADLSPLEAMLCYKNLWRVEWAFRTSKSLFATRPIFHKLDETIRGHVSCSFLALVLKKGTGGPHRQLEQAHR